MRTVFFQFFQVSQVYETIELSWLAKLVPFTDATHLETVVIDSAQSTGVQVRIDHQTNSLRFGTDMNLYKSETPEGPYVQQMPSEALRGQLQTITTALQQAVEIISTKETQLMHVATMKQLVSDYQRHCHEDHHVTLKRKL